jgi:diaminopimelate dehydrogenase
VVGLGRLGTACGEAVLGSEDLSLAGFVRRPEQVDRPLPSAFAGTQTAADHEAFGAIDAALVCLPEARTAEAIHEMLQHGVPVVECAIRWDRGSGELQQKLQHLAARHHVRAISSGRLAARRDRPVPCAVRRADPERSY